MLLRTPGQAAAWLRERVTGTLWTDSRKVARGDGFVAWPGAAVDARRYVDRALEAGASACLVEEEGADDYGFRDGRIASYRGLKAAAAPVAAAYFERPSEGLQVIAVTGTNGKTSITWWLAQVLGKLGMRCGIVGTLGIGFPGAMVSSGLTTPDPVLLQQQLRRFVDEGFAACAVEASSIGIAESRLDATRLELAIFTNFTQDHLDYHRSMDDYWAAKSRLFDWPGLRAAVINLDDAKGAQLNERLTSAALDVWTFSATGSARISARRIEHGSAGLTFEVCEGPARRAVSVAAHGLYNLSNLLAVIAAARALGISLEEAASACERLLPVPGRLETLAVDGLPLVVIDYAHTPDALEKVLAALRPLALGRGGSLWCVFGCGGDRDAGKRPLMAAAAEAFSDHVVVTSDNPRSEDPEAIIRQVLEGFTSSQAVTVQPDRAIAIRAAISMANDRDVVLLAGKGHEDYQEAGTARYPFSDRTHADIALNALAAGRANGGSSC